MKKMIFNESINKYVEQPSEDVIGFDKNNTPISNYSQKEIEEQESNLAINRLSLNSYTDDRYKICLSCEKFLKRTKICKECFCFVPLKIFFKGASCPMSKWNSIED
jgi:hypothetical protein